jgi:hypothetical protein
MPFAGSDDATEAARTTVLVDAVNDQQLADVARFAAKHNREEWLVGKALELARSDDPAAMARGIALLAFADRSELAETAWVQVDELIPRGGWLEDVLAMGRHAYRRNCWARHWYERFLTAPSNAEALAAHLLLEEAIDIRCVGWIDPEHTQAIDPNLRRFWRLTSHKLDAASKRRRDNLKDTLYWTRTMSQTQWPWI